MIRVHAKVPPKPDKVILKKARKSSAWVGIGAAGKCGTAVSDMAEISSLWSPPRPIDLWRYRQINHHEMWARPKRRGPERWAQGPMPGSSSLALAISTV